MRADVPAEGGALQERHAARRETVDAARGITGFICRSGTAVLCRPPDARLPAPTPLGATTKAPHLRGKLPATVRASAAHTHRRTDPPQVSRSHCAPPCRSRHTNQMGRTALEQRAAIDAAVLTG